MKEAILYNIIDNQNTIKCKLCAHYCKIKEGKTSTCMVRQNVNGKLFTHSWGKANGFAMDPIEKKPFYHFKPGSKVLSFGTPGCNFHCTNCQNWQLSNIKKGFIEILEIQTEANQIVDIAINNNADGIAYTYSEPTIFFEYARDTILECRKREVELFHVFVSNGYLSTETIDIIEKEKLISAINIDLKFMNEAKYKSICGGNLKPVLDNIKRFNKNSNIHLEIINLLIPGENDSERDIHEISEFVYTVSPTIPLHFNRFHPANKMIDTQATSNKTLISAREIALETGIKYVYIGNTNLKEVGNTYCPNCTELLIQRNHYGIVKNVINNKTKCPFCNYELNVII